jgi:hypothetical protein
METVFEWDDLADDTLTEKIKQADAAINPPVVPAPILITLSGTGLAANAVIQCNTRKPRP